MPMAIVNPSIVEISEKVDSRYTLVVETSKRARQLVSGAQPLIDPKEMKPLMVAIDEVNRGLLTYSRDPETEE
ncbi:MAG: DNA-directed RNA polymerase subunit omega [Candidatus Limiplasma sp.]|nr:DNA-directed RNA polymerase subunit omega [Candidatus Limiplasma sp.]